MMSSTNWYPIDWVAEKRESFFVVVTHDGRQVLARGEEAKLSIVHKCHTTKVPYDTCQQYREDVSSCFGIINRLHVVMTACLTNYVEDYCYFIQVLVVIDEDVADVGASYLWLDWASSAQDLKLLWPHPRISRFVSSYLCNKEVEELNLSQTPWRRLGFFETITDHMRQLVTRANLDMTGEPEQDHFGTLSTVYKVPTNKGVLFAKIGLQGNGEPRRTRAVTTMLPNHTIRLLGSNDELELMLSEDHGPPLMRSYFSNPPLRHLSDDETKTLFEAILSQWAQLQRESMQIADELSASGIPLYDASWIRASFKELGIYVREVALDTELPEVLGFGNFMERVFEIWDRFRIPESLVHGDLHVGNIAQPGGLGTELIFFDWDSAFIGHPFLDLASNDDPEMGLGEEVYLEHWKDYGDGESLKTMALWTKPVRIVIEAVREMNREVWTAEEKRNEVGRHVECLMEEWEACKSELILKGEVSE